MTTHFLKSLIDNGVVDPSEKNGHQLAQEALDYLRKLGSDELVLTVDHTDNLLKHARSFSKLGDNDNACLLYAIYIEHKLNSYMALLAGRKNLSTKDTEALIRDTSYRAKCSWLLHIFGIKAIGAVHLNRITKLMELRNSYVHYKWKPHNEQVTKEVNVVVQEIEKTINYLRGFEAKYLRLTSPRKVNRLLKKRN